MTTPSTEQPPPEQEQAYPGRTAEMDPHPRDEMRDYEGRGLLDGLRALVTGGDSGIGRAVAVAFAKEGADVAIAYLSEQEDEDAARTAELVGQAGRRCVTIRGDLAEEGNCDRAVELAVTELGGLDLLVNNVATQEPVDDLTKLSTEQWDRTFRVNIYSYFWTTRAALRHLPDGGVIINTASTAGLRPRPGLTWYNGSKGAAVTLTKSMAGELGPKKIRVCAICPVIGETGMLERFMGMPDTPENRARFLATIPLGRFSKPDDVANAALFLASPESSMITGVALEVDGGRCV